MRGSILCASKFALRSLDPIGHVERLIGSIRRDCLDHVILFGEAHLRRSLAEYASYYNKLRTHRSLTKGPTKTTPN
ncbi:MAG TPA: integrase core domain-containing protein [Reyranella sp.]|nr:integrase core domain-containing protein [Reyranella sp.]